MQVLTIRKFFITVSVVLSSNNAKLPREEDVLLRHGLLGRLLAEGSACDGAQVGPEPAALYIVCNL
jgi:hypothetical protein